MPNIKYINLTELNALCEAAAQQERTLRHTSPQDRARLLRAIADALDAAKSELVPIAQRESNLPEARLNGEVGRASGQFRLFAAELDRNQMGEVTSVAAMPERLPIPRPALDRFNVPIGTVAVFGASNFPFAFSVAGGDTASAMAAGCPVLVKAHPAHIELSVRVGGLISSVVATEGFPAAAFTLIVGDNEISTELVRHRCVRAVGFTGSQTVGKLFMDLAAAREEPIPVFAEMGSMNPVVVLPNVNPAAFSSGLVSSITMGVGQFCTKPGLIFGLDSPQFSEIIDLVAAGLAHAPSAPMLTAGIGDQYVRGVGQAIRSGATRLGNDPVPGLPTLLSVSGADYLANPGGFEEVFGPTALMVTFESFGSMIRAIRGLQGQLTGTIHYGEGDETMLTDVVDHLESKVGRLVFGGFPTGVEVCEAMQHGGPYPASSDGRFTSVGTYATQRWLRPVAYQNAPSMIRAKFVG